MTANYAKILGQSLANIENSKERLHRNHITWEGLKEEHAASTAPLLAQLEAHRAEAAADTEYARERLNKALQKAKRPHVDEAKAVAHELRANRIWQRWQRTLDAVQGTGAEMRVVSVAQQLAAEVGDDPAAATVAVQELEPYLQVRGADPTAVAETMGGIYRAVSPDVARADRLTQAAEEYERTVNTNTKYVAEELNNIDSNMDHAEMVLTLRVQPEQRAYTEGQRTIDIAHDIARGE